MVKVKRPHGHVMRRVKCEAKEKDQGSTLRRDVWVAIIWSTNLARYYFEVHLYCLRKGVIC